MFKIQPLKNPKAKKKENRRRVLKVEDLIPFCRPEPYHVDDDNYPELLQKLIMSVCGQPEVRWEVNHLKYHLRIQSYGPSDSMSVPCADPNTQTRIVLHFGSRESYHFSPDKDADYQRAKLEMSAQIQAKANSLYKKLLPNFDFRVFDDRDVHMEYKSLVAERFKVDTSKIPSFQYNSLKPGQDHQSQKIELFKTYQQTLATFFQTSIDALPILKSREDLITEEIKNFQTRALTHLQIKIDTIPSVDSLLDVLKLMSMDPQNQKDTASEMVMMKILGLTEAQLSPANKIFHEKLLKIVKRPQDKVLAPKDVPEHTITLEDNEGWIYSQQYHKINKVWVSGNPKQKLKILDTKVVVGRNMKVKKATVHRNVMTMRPKNYKRVTIILDLTQPNLNKDSELPSTMKDDGTEEKAVKNDVEEVKDGIDGGKREDIEFTTLDDIAEETSTEDFEAAED